MLLWTYCDVGYSLWKLSAESIQLMSRCGVEPLFKEGNAKLINLWPSMRCKLQEKRTRLQRQSISHAWRLDREMRRRLILQET